MRGRKGARPRPLGAEGGHQPLDPLEFLRRLWALDHRLAQLSKHMERHLGVTGPQRLAVRLIGQQPGLGPSDLAELLHVDRGAATGLVQRLERKGLVRRRPHQSDGRRWTLSLTEKGLRIDGQDSGTIEALVRRVLEASPPGDVAAAGSLLDELVGALTAPKAPKAP